MVGSFFNFGTSLVIFGVITIIVLTFAGGEVFRLLNNPIALLVAILIFFLLFKTN